MPALFAQEEVVQEDISLDIQEEPSDTQEETTLNIDSLFDDPSVEVFSEPDDTPINIRDKVLIEAAYGFFAGYSPGWDEVPWYDGDRTYSHLLGAKMDALLGLTIDLTDVFRVKNAFSFSVPDKAVFSIKEFYFEYDFLKKAFLQVGLYEIAWGISRFYPYTNLPARVPPGQDAGDAYIGRIKIPIGIGGLELLTMTRYDFLKNKSSPTFEEFAYGAKYNLILKGIDLDTGVYYYKDLPLFFFASLKTTLGNTELYAEGLAAVFHETWKEVRFSGNIGFVQDFFKRKLSLAGEVFYNGESNSAWWRPKTEILEEEAVDLFQGLNGAFALIIRPGIIGMRIFSQCLYSFDKNSAWLIPGISVSPRSQFTISLSVPMALGNRRTDRGNYYHNNIDKEDRPFSIVLGISFSGKFKYTL